MGFNYAKERRKFEAKWKRLRKEYEEAGMDEYAIEQLYLFDLEVFCSERSYSNHTQPLPDMHVSENTANHSTLLKKFESLSCELDELAYSDRYFWIDTIDNPELASKLKQLTRPDLELLTLSAIDEHKQWEIAGLLGCNQSVVSRRLKKIKKFLEK